MSTNLLPQKTVEAIRSVVGDGRIALHEPAFNGNEIVYLKECIDSGYVSSVGGFVDKFEHKLSQFTGAKFVVCVVNGTAALHIALKLAGVMKGDEVLAPALTFVATANAISYSGATPHFVDSTTENLGIDVEKLRSYLIKNTKRQSGICINKNSNRVIRAIVPMHTFGHPSDIEGLLSIAAEFNLVMVEDAAESLGSLYHGQHTGTFGLVGAVSFNGNKILTTGGGGAILTDDETLARRAKHLTTTAKLSHKWEFNHDEIGFNYRMPNINAALGFAQIEHLERNIQLKRSLFEKYKQALSRLPGLRIFQEPLNCRSNYWLQTLILEDDNVELRDAILEETNSKGLMTRPAWRLMSELLPYKKCPRSNLNGAELIYRTLINIPSSPQILDVK